MHGIFRILGMITVDCVLLITGYLVIPAFRQSAKLACGNF